MSALWKQDAADGRKGKFHDDHALLAATAEAVFGPLWRRPLAEALEASHATVKAAASGGPLSPALKRRLGRWAAEVRASEREAARRRLRLLAKVEEWENLEE